MTLIQPADEPRELPLLARAAQLTTGICDNWEEAPRRNPKFDPRRCIRCAHIEAEHVLRDLVAAVGDLQQAQERLRAINSELCSAHNGLLADGARWQSRAEVAEAQLQALQQRRPHIEHCFTELRKFKVPEGYERVYALLLDELATLTQPGAAGQERKALQKALFVSGQFRLHTGGVVSPVKIDCDALTDYEVTVVALWLRSLLPPFGAVEGVPTGGARLADVLSSYVTDGPLLIVDDVLTTGASMEQQRAGREAVGAVIFARGRVPPWVTPLFTLTQPGERE